MDSIFVDSRDPRANDLAQAWWDSESRKSPYSTVCDPYAEDFCEDCEQVVDYSDGSKHGKCGCAI